MKITLIYDNTSFRSDLQADWGFAALVETDKKKILFDTGANGKILLSSMQKLRISPDEIDTVFISHPHFDHTGGLAAFLRENKDVHVFIPPSFRFQEEVREITDLEIPLKLSEGLYSTGQLEGIEQALCVQTEKGVVIIVGCAHPDMHEIIHTASRFGQVYGIIGGMHGTESETLKGIDLICPTHCTQHKTEMKQLYPEQFIEGGAGRTIEIA